MSCGCPNITIAPTICCTPTTESLEYTFENQNAIGIGVFDNDTDNLVGFRGIASDTLALTVTLDAANKAIIISFNDELLIDDIPTATETIRGIAEVATQAETNAGAADDKIVTPLKLSTMQSTETQIGVLRIATQAEVTTGTNDTDAVTPLKLATFADTQLTTRTFADAVARAAAVPSFDGQIGVQLDTNALIVATGTIAGTFSPNIVIGGTLDVTGASTFNGAATFNGSVALAGASGVAFGPNEVDFDATTIAISGTPVGATDSVLCQLGGAVDVKALSGFLSDAATNSGWTNFSNSLVRKTGDCNTITLPELAQVVDTLIQTLGSSLQIPVP